MAVETVEKEGKARQCPAFRRGKPWERYWEGLRIKGFSGRKAPCGGAAFSFSRFHSCLFSHIRNKNASENPVFRAKKSQKTAYPHYQQKHYTQLVENEHAENTTFYACESKIIPGYAQGFPQCYLQIWFKNQDYPICMKKKK